ncbi:DNAJ1, partial [Symbiodinium pilosum]
ASSPTPARLPDSLEPEPDKAEETPAAKDPDDIRINVEEPKGRKSAAVRHRELYDLMKVEPDATEQDLRNAYKRRALALHPDKGGNEEDFKAMKYAYDVLTDPEKRTVYDLHGQEGLRQMEMAKQMEANGQFFAPIAMLLSLADGKRRLLAFLLLLLGLFFMLPFILITLKWDGSVGFHWTVALIPVWLVQLPICCIQQCVAPEPPEGDEEEWGEDERQNFKQQKKEARWIHCQGLVVLGLLLSFQILVLLRLEGDITASWFLVMLPGVLLEAWWLVLKVRISPIKWAMTDPVAAAEAHYAGSVWKSRKFWYFMFGFVQLGMMRLIALLLLAECADSGSMSWWVVPVPLYFSATFRILNAALACGSSSRPGSGIAMAAAGLAVAFWLTMLLLAIGKLDGGTYSAGLVFSPLFTLFAAVTCLVSILVGCWPRDHLEDMAKAMGEPIGRPAETE